MPGEEPLEGLEAFEPKRPRALTQREAEKAGQPKFQRYNKGGKSRDPHKCDHCVQRMVEGGKWVAPERASYHVHGGGLGDLYLCFAHMNDVRAAYGLKELKR